MILMYRLFVLWGYKSYELFYRPNTNSLEIFYLHFHILLSNFFIFMFYVKLKSLLFYEEIKYVSKQCRFDTAHTDTHAHTYADTHTHTNDRKYMQFDLICYQNEIVIIWVSIQCMQSYSPILVKDFKFRPILVVYGHWAVRVI